MNCLNDLNNEEIGVEIKRILNLEESSFNIEHNFIKIKIFNFLYLKHKELGTEHQNLIDDWLVYLYKNKIEIKENDWENNYWKYSFYIRNGIN